MEPHEFAGTIAPYHWDATPHWPEPVRPPAGAPNVVVVLLDDVGFAQLGCFGSDIATPHIDRLAADGLRYRNFHTTALCSPTRACVLTGRNHHNAGMGRINELATGFPGYDACIPPSVGFLPEMLTPHGYAAYAVGKWHLTPEEETHLGASRERWPLGRGFERFYGFFDGEAHQNAPALVHDSHQVDPPRSVEDGYHLTEDIVDRAIEFTVDLRHADPDKPFFLYVAPGACHSPHQAPAEWIERYRGAFDDGWDVWRERALARQVETGPAAPGTRLSPRPEWVPAWDIALRADPHRLRPLHGGLRRLPLPHRPPPGPPGRAPADHRRARRHPLPAAVRQRGQLGGWPDRVAERRPHLERHQPVGRRGVGAHRRDRRAPDPQQLPVGLDRGRQHAVQALEARGPRGRGGRPAHRALAGPGARPRAATAPGCAPSTCTPSTWRPPSSRPSASRRPDQLAGVAQRPLDGTSFLASLTRRRRPRAPHHPVLRDVRLPGHLPRGLEGGHPPPHPGRRARPRPRRRGSSTTSRPTPPSATTGPRPSPSGCRR